MNHATPALFTQRTCIPTPARSTGFCLTGRPTGPKNLNFSTTSDSHFYFFNGLFGGWKEPNRRVFIQIGPYKPLKRAPKDDFLKELRDVALLK